MKFLNTYTIAIAGLALTAIIRSYAQTSTLRNQAPTVYESPVLFTPRISGSFGELRPGHFHAGIDIKSPTRTVGAPIHAVADGYIYRIKVQERGYGKALYIRHRGGYVSVYAHLDSFAPPIEALIDSLQYRRRQYFIDYYPKAHEWPVRKGEKIGTLGNTGNSTGPHLHFEWRKAGGTVAVHPLLYNPNLYKDDIPPTIQQVRFVLLDRDFHSRHQTTITLPKGTNNYLHRDTLLLPTGYIGVLLRGFDRINGSANKVDFHSIAVRVDSITVFRYYIDAVHFNKQRYIHAHIDYGSYVRDRQYWHRCYRLPGNALPLYPYLANEGVFYLAPGSTKSVEIIARDFHGNTTSARFVLKGDLDQTIDIHTDSTGYYIDFTKSHTLHQGPLRLRIPAHSFYQNLFLDIRPPSSLYEPFSIGADTIPVHRYMALRIAMPSDSIVYRREKMVLTYLTRDSKRESWGGQWKGGSFVVDIRKLGVFQLSWDTVAPTITPLWVRKSVRYGDVLKWRIEDNLPTAGKARPLKVEGQLNDQWALVHYDPKSRTASLRISKRWSPGNYTLRITATDDRNNTRVWQSAIVIRK